MTAISRKGQSADSASILLAATPTLRTASSICGVGFGSVVHAQAIAVLAGCRKDAAYSDLYALFYQHPVEL